MNVRDSGPLDDSQPSSDLDISQFDTWVLGVDLVSSDVTMEMRHRRITDHQMQASQLKEEASHDQVRIDNWVQEMSHLAPRYFQLCGRVDATQDELDLCYRLGMRLAALQGWVKNAVGVAEAKLNEADLHMDAIRSLSKLDSDWRST